MVDEDESSKINPSYQEFLEALRYFEKLEEEKKKNQKTDDKESGKTLSAEEEKEEEQFVKDLLGDD